MTVYTFYLCQEGGSAASFEAFDLPGDDATDEVAQAMLLQHASCAYVAVWQGERVLGRVRRQGAGQAKYTSALR